MATKRLDKFPEDLLTDDERKRIANRALVLIVSGFLGLGLLSAGIAVVDLVDMEMLMEDTKRD